MAKIGRRRLARETVRMLSAQPERQADIVQQLAGYLIANKQVGQLDLLMKDIADEMYLQNKHLSAEVTHVFDLSDATRQAITEMLAEATGARSVDLESRQEANLIGGVIIKTPRAQFDMSIRGKISRLGRVGA